MNTIIRVAGIKNTSCDDGPGMRTVLFLKGCSKNCPGCQNAQLNDGVYSCSMSVEQLITELVKKCKNRKLTISGGEPLEQLPALKRLLPKLSQLHMDVCLYTGWNLQQVPADIIKWLHYLKVGPFIQAQADAALQFVGSRNQRMYRVDSNGMLTAMELGA